jgi:tetratricopeptide (TPR) repeat protein
MTRTSEQGLKRVEEARKNRGWQRQDARWYMAASVSLSVLKRFRGGQSVREEAFIDICKAVGIDKWEEIVDDTVQETELPISSSSTDSSAPDPNFVGRENAIAQLNTLVNQGAKVIVIQSPGGVGKTTLAKKYLREKFGESVLEFPIAKETKDIASVESLIEERLRQLGEEPGREFFVSLERLKQKLKIQATGVLIDNLEPALDESGRFVEEHRRYVELLRVLADDAVKSVTLITSREPLAESVDYIPYPLPSLSESAWQEFFNNRGINTHTPALAEMHQAFGGNALAMKILCDPIQRYFNWDVAAYWQEHKTEDGLLVELAVENLIKQQFNRLQQISPEAYRLLYRLGCYRYQDVPRVPIEGLFCLLWDVSEVQRRRVVQSLRDRSLVEFCNVEYWLHPVIRAEARERLKLCEEWELANHKAAEFWTDSIKTIETVEDGLRALEACSHYLGIRNFEQACSVILKKRDSGWTYDESLGRSFYRLGLLEQMTSTMIIILKEKDITSEYYGSELYNVLGSMYWLKGHTHVAIKYYVIGRNLASKFEIEDFKLNSLLNIALCKIDLWELEESLTLFQDYKSLSETSSFYKHKLTALFCSALVNSLLGFKQEASFYAEKAFNEMPLKIEKLSPWMMGYSLLFLGLTYKNLGNIGKSFNMYCRAIAYAEESHYTQVKAKALSGIAEVYQEQGDFEKALLHHAKAIEILDKIGARCDLAEAYYQQGLTYQKMGEVAKSQENFDKAIQLFSQMEAPKQVEKVQQAIESGG